MNILRTMNLYTLLGNYIQCKTLPHSCHVLNKNEKALTFCPRTRTNASGPLLIIVKLVTNLTNGVPWRQRFAPHPSYNHFWINSLLLARAMVPFWANGTTWWPPHNSSSAPRFSPQYPSRYAKTLQRIFVTDVMWAHRAGHTTVQGTVIADEKGTHRVEHFKE